MRYEHLAEAFFNRPWAITESKMEELKAFAIAKLAGASTAWEGERQEPLAATTYQGSTEAGRVAVLPVRGVLMPHVGMLEAMSGATSTEALKARFNELVADPGVKTIILDINSPGGSVYGIDEFAATIREAAGRKNIVAVSHYLNASAAYYLASAAGEVVSSPSSETGSIGVLAVHYDYSGKLELEGIKPTLVKAGKFKAEGHPDIPFDADALSHLQEDVDRYYSMFVNAVAKGRGVSVSAVRNGFGEGRVLGADDAVRAGLTDRVATIEATIARFLGGGRVARRGAAAEVLTVKRELAEAEKDELEAAWEENHRGPGLQEVIDDEPDQAAADRDLLQLDQDRLLTGA